MKDCNPVNAPVESGVYLSCYDEAYKVDFTLYKILEESDMYKARYFVRC